jgi:hypothetical protein
MAINELLANVVFLIHIAVIIFFVSSPFIDSPFIWVLALISTVFTTSHWCMPGPAKSTCFLTVCERWLRGCDSDDSFFHSIMKPIYTCVDCEEGGITDEFTSRAVWAGMFAIIAANFALITSNWKRTLATFRA